MRTLFSVMTVLLQFVMMDKQSSKFSVVFRCGSYLKNESDPRHKELKFALVLVWPDSDLEFVIGIIYMPAGMGTPDRAGEVL